LVGFFVYWSKQRIEPMGRYASYKLRKPPTVRASRSERSERGVLFPRHVLYKFIFIQTCKIKYLFS